MNKPIRVLYTISNFNTAGSGKVIYDLAKNVDKNKFEIEIACEDDKGDFFTEIKSLGLPIHLFETKTPYRPYFSLISRVKQIARFYRKNHYDIVHSWQWSSDWTEALAARFAGIKWIYTKKAMGFRSKHWKIKSRLAHHIITINNDMQGYFQNKKQKSLIPLGIDLEYYDPGKFERDPSSENNFNIITVANLVPVKGIETLIEAVQILKNPNIRLMIVGDDNSDYSLQLKQKVKAANLESSIKFQGKQTDIRPFLANSDMFVIPTLNEGRREGMPMALVEAMAMTKPVLGSNISGIKFVLKDYKDLLFTAGSSTSLANKIAEIMAKSEEELSKLGEELRHYCYENYSLDKFIAAHEQLYHNLLY